MYAWLNGYTVVELQGFLVAAATSYRKLVMGGSVREVVDQNGERVVFTSANLKALSGYLTAINAAIEAKQAGVSVSAAPIRFTF
jgi:hypothetical protein